MAAVETDAMPDKERRARVPLLFPPEEDILKLTPSIRKRAWDLEAFGFKAADAVHVAAAERGGADVLLSCDDRLCRLAKRHKSLLQVPVVNPVDWLKEMEHDPNA
jgi:predicted nucleic acid-binding protein